MCSQTPERSGGKLGAPSPHRPRTDSRHAQESGDEEFVARHQPAATFIPGSVVVANSDVQHAFRFPVAGRPAYRGPFPMGDPVRSMSHPVFAVDFKGLPPAKTFISGGSEDPVSAPLQVRGYRIVSTREFRLVGGEGKLELLLLTRDLQARALTAGIIQSDGKRDWRTGARLPPGASGDGANNVWSARCAPRTLRKSFVRELLTPLAAPRHVGSPPIMNT